MGGLKRKSTWHQRSDDNHKVKRHYFIIIIIIGSIMLLPPGCWLSLPIIIIIIIMGIMSFFLPSPSLLSLSIIIIMTIIIIVLSCNQTTWLMAERIKAFVKVSVVYLFWWGSTVSVPGSAVTRAGVDRNTRSRLASCLGLGEGDHRDGEGDDGEQGGIHLHKEIESLI